MAGITELDELLASMSPEVQSGEFVFCTVSKSYGDYAELNPIASFTELEGLTLVLPFEKAEEANLPFEGKFKQITLTVHSSLEAVGLTAAVANKLADNGISANVIAAYYHDHVFVPSNKVTEALTALQEFGR
jgi:hypothetical protein